MVTPVTVRALSVEYMEKEAIWEQSHTGTIFQSPNFLRVWLAHFPGDAVYLGIFVKQELVGIAPLLARNQDVYLIGTPPVLTNEQVTDYGDILAKPTYELVVWKAVQSHAKTFFSHPVTQCIALGIRQDSPSFSALSTLSSVVEKEAVAPYIRLSSSWDEYLLSLDRHNRHEIRRKLRNAEKEGVTFSWLRDIQKEKDTFFRLLRASSEEKKRFLSPPMEAFFTDLMTAFAQTSQVCFLTYKGNAIAAVFLFVTSYDMLVYNSGFDPAYASLSPGVVVIAYLLQEAIKQKKKRFDFLRGQERYKYHFGAQDRQLYRIILPLV